MIIDTENIYQEYINSHYPQFLRKLGINAPSVKAEGAIIEDSMGKVFIDCVGGYGIFNLGHNNQQVIDALTDQLNRKQLLTRPLLNDVPAKLARCLSDIAPGDLCCSFVCNSGSEAIDNALKLVRLIIGKKNIITGKNSFHGYTFGALSASGIPTFRKAFEPLLPGFINVPFGEIDALKAKIVSSNVGAVLLEPVQHEAGVHLPPNGYFRKLREICDDFGILLILDEVKTGFGKTGKMFACEHFDIVPDILVVGKSLGGGLMPIGGIISRKNLWKRFSLSFPMSASSYAGNVLACRAAIETINFIKGNDLIELCRMKGNYLLKGLKKVSKKHQEIIKNVYGLGLLASINANHPKLASRLVIEMIRDGILVLQAYGNPSHIMLEPPLVISYEQIDMVIEAFSNACVRVASGL
ncbi:MAG: aminotransferase class III-fold pyridoxal phosphate-dependent enzyme [Candidatus Dadabacteria bacterium]|nr:aminotransferase class III-fold pyridoxal phosphate-dependent enzyme [Candidatus Dadabacteria bacterium]